jgi:D-alanyl-D-alanine carboxypeptidase
MPGLNEAFERVGAVLERELPHAHASGASIAVTDAESVLGVVTRGFADAASATPFRAATRSEIGSISKSFTAILALQEMEAGRLDIHAPVCDIVPWVELREPYGRITLHHLLTHTSGLPLGTEDSADDVFAVWRLRLLDPGFSPGSRFHYSNDGYKLVGLAVAHVAGRPLATLLRERILQPLGMAATDPCITNETRADIATGYQTMFDDRPAQERHPLVTAPWTISASGDGSIVSNAIDMSAYVRMLLARGRGPDGRLLSEDAFGLMTSRFIPDDDQEGWFYGYGLWVGGDERVRWKHSGGMVGYTAQLTIDAGAGIGAIMLLNGDGNRSRTVGFAVDAVTAAIAGAPPPPEPASPDPARIPNAERYAGTYHDGVRTIQVIAEGDRLRLREDATALDVVLESEEDVDDAFLVPHPDWDRHRLRFARDGDGSIVEAFHGDAWFRGERLDDRPAPELPEEWAPFPGHYRTYNPWSASFRIIARKGRLVLTAPWEADDLELVALDDGSFRVGVEAWRPDRVRFDVIVEGRATRARFNESPSYRSFTP